MTAEPGSETRVARAVVVGAGVMGSGIAQVVASAGIEVTLVDNDATALDRARERLTALLSRAKDAGELRTSTR
ncbi:MAG: 3-hydroxyacyl-CoA dehydrogenase NAD-binding domain-containing protein, partial [Planctomycetota bacterium]